jgi:hypothetical protein
MIELKPNTALATVSISKLQTASCPRKYFWRYIMNLEPPGFSVGQWFGAMAHAGLQVRLSGGNARLAELAMRREDRKRMEGAEGISADTQIELGIWRAIAPALVEGFFAEHGAKMRLLKAEQEFQTKLPCGVIFRGKIDGLGTVGPDSALFEFKFLGRVDKTVFETMAFNGQVHSYVGALPAAKRPKKFAFCVIRKPGKWLKKGQTVPAFVEEIKADIKSRPEWYFAVWVQDFTQVAVDAARADICSATEDLLGKYWHLVIPTMIADPANWPRCDRQCAEYGQCPFLDLCKDSAHWISRAKTIYRIRKEQEFTKGGDV